MQLGISCWTNCPFGQMNQGMGEILTLKAQYSGISFTVHPCFASVAGDDQLFWLLIT